jgi:hypothetical protein
LHWQLDSEFPVGRPDEAAWWATRPSIRIGDRNFRRLEDKELLLALLLHGSKHLWEQLSWLAEIAQFLRNCPEVDWLWIQEEAARLGARRRIALGLSLLSRWFAAGLPPATGVWVDENRAVERLAGRISGHWADAGEGAALGALDRLSTNLSLCDSGRQRANHVVDVVFRPGFEEWSRWQLPRGLHALYLPLRAFRLLGKLVRGGYTH